MCRRRCYRVGGHICFDQNVRQQLSEERFFPAARLSPRLFIYRKYSGTVRTSNGAVSGSLIDRPCSMLSAFGRRQRLNVVPVPH